MEGSPRLSACRTVCSGVAYLTQMVPPHPAHLSAAAPSSRPCPSLPDSTPTPPPMYLAVLWPCRWASAATLLRTVRRLARTCWQRDDQHWKRGESISPACLTQGRGRGGHPPGQRVSQSCLLHVCGERGHQKGRPGTCPAWSHLTAFARAMPSAEHILPSGLLLLVPY